MKTGVTLALISLVWSLPALARGPTATAPTAATSAPGLIPLPTISAVPDAASLEALVKSQDFLTNPKAREAVTSADPKAQKADDAVQSLTGGSAATNDEIYGLAADILKNVMMETNGDPDKVNELIRQAMKDPMSFATTLTPEQKKKVEEISKKVNATGLPAN